MPPEAPESIFRRPGASWSDGDTEAAFEWVVTCKLAGLVRFAYARYAHRTADAEDIVGGAILDAFRYRRSYDPAKHRQFSVDDPHAGERAFVNWLYVIVRRRGLAWIRQPIPDAAALLEFLELLPEAPPLQWSDVVDLLPELGRLKPKYREAIELISRDGLSHAEAARASRWPCTEGAMKVRFWKAKQQLAKLVKLRLLLDAQGGEPC